MAISIMIHTRIQNLSSMRLQLYLMDMHFLKLFILNEISNEQNINLLFALFAFVWAKHVCSSNIHCIGYFININSLRNKIYVLFIMSSIFLKYITSIAHLNWFLTRKKTIFYQLYIFFWIKTGYSLKGFYVIFPIQSLWFIKSLKFGSNLKKLQKKCIFQVKIDIYK